MHTNWCILIEISMKIRMKNFLEAMNECCVIDDEFPLSCSCVFMRCFYEAFIVCQWENWKKNPRKRKFTEVDETKNDPPEIVSYCLWLLFLQCFSKRLEHHHLDSICCICWPHSKKENCAIICCCGDLKNRAQAASEQQRQQWRPYGGSVLSRLWSNGWTTKAIFHCWGKIKTINTKMHGSP